MPSLRNALRHTINLSSLHQRWWWNDPDCLLAREAGSRLTEAEVQSSITLVGLSGGLVISSDDLSRLEPRRLQWIARLVPNLGLRGLPVDQNNAVMAEIYQLELENWGQCWQAIAIFNWQDQPADCVLQLNKLGFPRGAKLHVFDYWRNEYLPTNAHDLSFARVPAHGCKLLRVCEASKLPRLVGDTLHISMGKELETITCTEDKLVIQTIDMGREVEGDLWFWLPTKPRSALCNQDAVIYKDIGNGIYSIQLKFSQKAQVEICF
jgi:Alpha galactosidase C-terminal beta sandwich domain